MKTQITFTLLVILNLTNIAMVLENELSDSIEYSKGLNIPLTYIEGLLKAGVNPDGDKETETKIPLLKAASLGDIPLAQMLLNYKAQINKKNFLGNTALNMALQKNHPPLVEFLLQNKADPNTIDDQRHTPLHLMASNHYPYNALSLGMLLNAGADLHMKDWLELTVLERAKDNNNLTFIEAVEAWKKKQQ